MHRTHCGAGQPDYVVVGSSGATGVKPDCFAEARRGARVVEWAGLENRNTRKRIVGSNPTLSASK